MSYSKKGKRVIRAPARGVYKPARNVRQDRQIRLTQAINGWKNPVQKWTNKFPPQPPVARVNRPRRGPRRAHSDPGPPQPRTPSPPNLVPETRSGIYIPRASHLRQGAKKAPPTHSMLMLRTFVGPQNQQPPSPGQLRFRPRSPQHEPEMCRTQ